jgi:hypothetical protein
MCLLGLLCASHSILTERSERVLVVTIGGAFVSCCEVVFVVSPV